MPAVPAASASRAVILDTDIGTDVDDAMALALLLGLPGADLLGVTTVYGDTELRARLARRYGALAARDLRVRAGAGATLSGREVWWAGHEGSLHSGLEKESYEDGSAVEWMVRTAAERPGQVDVLAIGPLTNIALALDADPAFAENVRTLWVMGGSFDGAERTEHNFRSDAVAAARVFGSGIRTVVTGLEVTRRVRVLDTHLRELKVAGPLGAALVADIDQWWKFWDEQWNVPHDPVAVLSLARPELFTLSGPGTVRIELDGEDAGASTFVPDTAQGAAQDTVEGTGGAAGRTRLVLDLDAEAVAEEIVRGIVAAGAGR
ncbi:nucleoside hydrolase [Nocardiopsis ganjiahuensis]|uniref:nucleoside hydrolase n=1 Tax=Nocardiopsis ganjiahuensis TaxID=239984 RepID=UPI000348F3A9|nr:nucleoside hydrolase [Nocardiopsis ganjiahuensis]